ncbi:uncharacterized protein [Nicotiana sylvestris]|uniref:uncharacterized protein n=1 Tax=Nicotiana sylvestris TaxID=4096 RepID=UPI00388CDDAA
MRVVRDVSNFRGWVDKLLKIAPMDGRSWKTLSNHFGWKVKTHGFAIRGVTAEAVAASRVSLGTRTPSEICISLERSREIVLGSSSAKRKAAEEENSEEEKNETPAISVPSSIALTSSPTPPLTITPPIVHHTETGSSSKSVAMRRVIIEIPAESSLLRKSKLMKRIAPLEKIARDSQLEATNWKGQFESAQLDIENLQERKNTLEQRVRALTSELAVTKASSHQAEKEKEHLESSFSEQLSKASEEIRKLKALLNQNEVYAGELVQNLTQAQEDLRISADKVRALECSHTSLQASHSSALAENEELKNDITAWGKDYEILEEKSVVEDFPSPVDEVPVVEALMNFEADTGIMTISNPIEPVAASQVETTPADAPAQIEPAAIDVPASIPQLLSDQF